MPPTKPPDSASDPRLQQMQASILRICQMNPDGASDAQVRQGLEGGLSNLHGVRVTAYNRLLKQGRLRLVRRVVNGNSETLYVWVSPEDAKKLMGLDATENMLYDVVRRAGKNGATKRDLKIRSGLKNTTEIKQIMERLIGRRLVKEIKSVQAANKIIYILAELEPSSEHTGGAWYNEDQEFDEEFINAIYVQVLKFMKARDMVNIRDITAYVADLKVSNEQLTESDLQTLVDTMTYDGVVEELKGERGRSYRVRKVPPAGNQLGRVPCGSCRVFSDCKPGGVISPTSCVYMKDWLKGVELDW